MSVVAMLGLSVLASAQAPQAARSVRITAVTAEAMTVGVNLIGNFSFEDPGPGDIPLGWEWDRRNTDATCIVDDTVAHSGRRSVKITNGTPFGAHVYGMLLHTKPVRLDPGKAYTFSAWVRSADPGNLGLLTGGDWQYRAYVRPTGQQWARFWVTFTARDSDADCILRFSTESRTTGTWIDDVKLEEGDAPTPALPPGEADLPQDLIALKDRVEITQDGSFRADFMLTLPRREDGGVHVRLAGVEPYEQPLSVAPGVWRLSVEGECDGANDEGRAMNVRLGARLSARTLLRFLSPRNAAARIEKVAAGLPSLDALMKRVIRAGQDPSYPRTTLTVLRNFVPYVREDLAHGETRRALQQVGDLERMAARVRMQMADALSGKRMLPGVPRYSAVQRPRITGGAFTGPVRWPNGRTETRPIIFNGFGHFGQVVGDMEKWPDYGANIIQIEFGPNSVFPAEVSLNDEPMRAMRTTLDRAAKAGVAVCLLISPHYMPAWALDKWPQLRKRREGFLAYCLHAPEGQDLLKRFIKVALTPLADHPGLHSICLSNEPVNVEEPCDYARKLWWEWLGRRHRDVATMNARWGTSHASFTEAPLPDPFAPRPNGAIWIDYVRFNQEFFAGWHRMLAGAVHEVAPDLPVHAKAMTWTLVNDGEIARYGADATLFAGFSQINGNDSFNAYSFGGGEFAQNWAQNAMGHDLQRSVLDAPIFNSENHLIHDRETRYVPGAHIRAALWQAAIHGQGANTIWVWERTFDPRSDFAGSIMHRPECAEAVGIVNHDLNRAANEIVALQRATPQVCLLHSTSGAVLDMGPHGDSIQKAYVALTFLGVRIGFVTERQLEQGRLPIAPVLILPHAAHVSDAAFAALMRYRGRIVTLGEDDLLTLNEWGQPRTGRLSAVKAPYRYGPTDWRMMFDWFAPRLAAWGVAPPVALADASGGAALSVEWRTAQTTRGVLVNMCNQRQGPAKLRLTVNRRTVAAVDVLTGERVTGPFTLQPLEVRLLRVGEPRPRPSAASRRRL